MYYVTDPYHFLTTASSVYQKLNTTEITTTAVQLLVGVRI